MNTLIKNTLICFASLLAFGVAQAQITPYLGLEFRAKQDYSSIHRIVSSSTNNSAGAFDPGVSLGARWNNGVGLQLEVRNASHVGQFSLKNDPAYSASSDLAKIDFKHRGLFVPLFVTMNKGLGKKGKWGLRGKIGGGMFFANTSFEENQDFRGTIQSNVTGSLAEFAYDTRFLDAYNDRFMVESGIGIYLKPSPEIMITCNLFASQSIGEVSYRVLEYDDGVNDPGQVSITNTGQSLGLQIGVKYLFSKSK